MTDYADIQRLLGGLIDFPERRETYNITIKNAANGCDSWGITLRITPNQLNIIQELLELTKERNN